MRGTTAKLLRRLTRSFDKAQGKPPLAYLPAQARREVRRVRAIDARRRRFAPGDACPELHGWTNETKDRFGKPVSRQGEKARRVRAQESEN